MPDQFTAFAIVVLTAKALSIATVLRAERFRRYQGAAVGIATSIPVAFLLLIGLCIANFKL